jgi:hypothetical protein
MEKKTLALILSTLLRVILANKVLYSKDIFLKGSNNDVHFIFTLWKNLHPFVCITSTSLLNSKCHIGEWVK